MFDAFYKLRTRPLTIPDGIQLLIRSLVDEFYLIDDHALDDVQQVGSVQELELRLPYLCMLLQFDLLINTFMGAQFVSSDDPDKRYKIPVRDPLEHQIRFHILVRFLR
jgi:hypothetical protein